MYRFYFLIGLVTLMGACSGSTNTVISPFDTGFDMFPEDVIGSAFIESHLRYLASDELMGRETGHYGSDVAARYIAEQFRAYDLLPIPGGLDYYQPVPLSESAPASSGSVTISGRSFDNGDQMLILDGPAIDRSAAFVLAGYGLSYDDYGDIDVSGKIVFVRAGLPEDQGIRTGLNNLTAKRQAAAERGAAALVELYDLSFPWANAVRYLGRSRLSVGSESSDTAQQIPHIWINDPGHAVVDLLSTMTQQSVTVLSSGVRQRTFFSNNVVGMVEGNDPRLRDEYVVLMAHYDHIGAGMRAGSGATPADSIFNGARDNGMGTVAVLSAAWALRNRPPARSVICLAVTGEEKGLLGSSYYADNPLIPLEKTVFVLNIDGAGYSDTTLVTLVGKGRTSADDAIEDAVTTYRLRTIDDPTPDKNLFNRSDNVAFASKGVPAPTFSPGFRSFDDHGVVEYYHRPQDEADDIDYAYFKRFVQAYTRAARLIADMKERPYWQEGDIYEPAAQELYGRD